MVCAAQQQPPRTEQHTEFSRARFEVITPLVRDSRYAEAEQLTRELLAKAQSQLDPESLEIGRILMLLADIMNQAGKSGNPETLQIIERSCRIKNKVLGEDHDEALRTASLYAAILYDQAQLTEANAVFDRIAKFYERNTGRNSTEAITGLTNIASQLLLAGQPERARGYAEHSVDLAERHTGAESAVTAKALSTLGFIRQAMGEKLGAAAALERASKAYEKSVGPSQRLTIASYNNLAIQYSETGKFAESRRLYDQANAARERLLGPDHPDNAIGQHNLGLLLHRMGDYAGARTALEKALALRERTIGPKRFLTGTTLSALAEAMFDLQDYRTALGYADRAVSTLIVAAGEHHPSYQTALMIRAFILERTAGVVPSFHEAILAARLRNEHVRLTTQGMAEHTALSYIVEPSRNAADLTVSLALRETAALGADGVRDAWDLRIHSRAVVLDEMSSRRRLAGYQVAPELAEMRQALIESRRTLAHLVLTAGAVEGSAKQISETIEKREKLERQLGLRSAALRRDMQRADIGFAEVAAQLPPRSALVSYVRFQKYPDRRASIAAFVLRAGNEEPSLISIGTDAEVERAVSDWRSRIALVADDPSRAGKRTESVARAAGEVLRKRVWDPVEPLLRGANLVFVVPDGPLHLVNFVALPVGADSYLVETGPTIHTLATERDLLWIERPSRAPSSSSSSSLLALANPAFDGARTPRSPMSTGVLRGGTPACADLQQYRFRALPASGVEAAEIAKLWTGPKRPTVLSGAAANEAEFRARAPGQRIIHLATHGFFLGQQCGSGGLIGEAALQSPLVLSGLALAGANRRDRVSDDEEDGLLTAEEVAGLNLEGVEWVVLSGCDTGLGQIRGAEGVLGLRRAFQTAGAATVIVSLWPVEDLAAREWMHSLYENRLKKGQNTAEALREASRTVLKARRQSGRSTHPFFWAAFVGAGDWR